MAENNKILIFSTAYYPFVGGAEVAVKEITDRISDTQFDLITAKMDKTLPKVSKVGKVNVYRVGLGIVTLDKLLLPFLGAVKTFNLNKKNNYKAFWCVMATYASGAAYLHNIFSGRKVPIILNLQEGDSEEHFGKRWFGMIDRSWKMALKRTQHLAVLSQFLKDRAERFGYKGPVSIIPNGVDVEKFEIRDAKYEIEKRKKIRKEWGFEEKDIVLITSSRLVTKNGVEDVIESLKFLPEEVKFVICGTGELEAKLKLKTENLKLENRVKFLGFVGHGELPEYLKASDIFIRASLSEGFGVSFMEAMAAKLPVIATPVGGIVDFLKDPASQGYDGTSAQTGYFCKPQNPQSIKEAVNRVISDVGENRVIENAYKMVKEKYDWSLIAEQMEGIFNKS